MRRLVASTKGVRQSRRYPGYLRVHTARFRLALAETLLTDAPDLIELMGIKETMSDLMARLLDPDACSAAGKLTGAILDQLGTTSPMDADSDEFNLATEHYYREVLRKKHLEEAFRLLEEDVLLLDSAGRPGSDLAESLGFALKDLSLSELLAAVRQSVMKQDASTDELRRLVDLILVTIHHDSEHAELLVKGVQKDDPDAAPIRRSADRSGPHRVACLG